jgi:hypothetical protein
MITSFCRSWMTSAADFGSMLSTGGPSYLM